MKLLVNLEYITSWGQEVCVEVSVQRRRGADFVCVCPLATADGRVWSGEVVINEREADFFTYRYLVCAGSDEGGRLVVLRREWDGVPRCFPYHRDRTFVSEDYWRDMPVLNHLYSSAYVHSVQQNFTARPMINYYDSTLVFRVQAPQLLRGQCLALVGSTPQLGEWLPQRALVMMRGGLHEWCLSLDAVGLRTPFEYKFVVMDEASGEVVAWEMGENRVFDGAVARATVHVVWDRRIRMTDKHWKAAGVVCPLFSMRSWHSQGVGDMGDLRLMVDWALTSGMRVIQLLPVYDTTQSGSWRDCYPYSAISIYALHPMYIDISQLAAICDGEFMWRYEAERKAVNALPQLDYERVWGLKMDYLRRLYVQEGEFVISGAAFKSFRKKNEAWLTPYCVFCHRRDVEGTCDFAAWGELAVYDDKEVYRYAQRFAREVDFYAWLQFILDEQLSAVSRYARSRGVILKGDIPIGISRTSVEAWKEPHYFNMNGSAGAPPDDFSVDGQNWGFPTYNWERMAADGYQWWIDRFRKMADYFDAYRIDHVLGFFRIWEIPVEARSGLLGHFAPCLPMSVEEIEGWGLEWRERMFTRPYITDKYLHRLVSDPADVEWLRSTCLEALGPDWYQLREAFDSERKVYDFFADKHDARAVALRGALCRIVQNVLFVRVGDGWCPRIAASGTFVYGAVSKEERVAFDRIYEHFYYHRHNDFWGQQAMEKLPSLVESTLMLCCAEDLGMVPACVQGVMDRLKILSLEIQTMPKAFGVRFARLENNPYRSVVTIFTHDMPTLREWWTEDAERTQAYWREVLQKDGDAPRVMPGWLCEEVVARHLFSPSMLCLISLQDWLSIDEDLRNPDALAERINVPADANHYWRYRMHLNIEDLMGAEGFNSRIRELIVRAERE